jgi:hypothetical protein
MNLREILAASRPKRVHPGEIHTVATLLEMELAFRDYVRLRKVSHHYSPGMSSQAQKFVAKVREQKIAYLEGRFPAFRPVYEKEFAR